MRRALVAGLGLVCLAACATTPRDSAGDLAGRTKHFGELYFLFPRR